MLLRAAESHTTPGERKSRASAKLGWCPIAFDQTPDIKHQTIFFIMSYDDFDSKVLERIADSLEEAFNPEECLTSTPLYRIAGALESIAKSMDSSFEAEWQQRFYRVTKEN